MEEILKEYFDLDVMRDTFPEVLAGFWFTIKLSILAGVLSLLWGLVLAVLRQTPGKVRRDHPLADDRLHRHHARASAADRHPPRLRVFR